MLQKSVFMSLLAFACFTQSYSQTISFGLGLGLDATNAHFASSDKSMRISDNFFDNMKLGFNVNAFASYKSVGSWGYTIEPGFIQKGLEYRSKLDNTYKYEINYNYIQLPMMADYYFNEKLSASAGPEIAYLVGSKNLYGEYTKFEISALLGVNYSLSEKIKIGFRYNHGLTSVETIDFTDVNGNKVSTSKTYNQYLQLNVKYALK